MNSIIKKHYLIIIAHGSHCKQSKVFKMTNDQWLFLGIAGYCLALAFLIGAIASNVRNSDKE